MKLERIHPTQSNKAHITISFEHFDDDQSQAMLKVINSPLRPDSVNGVKLRLIYNSDKAIFPLRRYGKLERFLFTVAFVAWH